MSTAPRPHTSPSTSSPPNGSRVQPSASPARRRCGPSGRASARSGRCPRCGRRASAGRAAARSARRRGRCPRGSLGARSALRTSSPDSGVPSLTHWLRISCLQQLGHLARELIGHAAMPTTGPQTGPDRHPGREEHRRDASAERDRIVGRAGVPQHGRARQVGDEPLATPPAGIGRDVRADRAGRSRRRARPGRPARHRPRRGSAACSIVAAAPRVAPSSLAALDRQRALRRPAAASIDGSSTSAIWSREPEPVERSDRHHDGTAGRAPSPAACLMLPRRSTNTRSGRTCASCARRRTEPVATVAPGREVGERSTDERVAGVAALGHRRDARAPAAGIDGRSLAECTATSARPSSTAACTSFTNTPWPPMPWSGTSTRAVARASRRRRARRRETGSAAAADAPTCSACQRARALPRVAMRTRTGPRRLQVEQVAQGLGEPLAAWRAGASFRRTVGSCSSLATMPRVRASTASRSRSSRPVELWPRSARARPSRTPSAHSCSAATSGATSRAVE